MVLMIWPEFKNIWKYVAGFSKKYRVDKKS
jgi:hypothetical protein